MATGPMLSLDEGGVGLLRRSINPFRRRGWVVKNAAATTRASHGLPAPTSTGTLSAVYDTTGEYIDCAMAASSNGGWTCNANMQPQTQYVFGAIFKTNAFTSQRYWIGLSAGDPRASDNPATHLAAFRATSGVDTYWMACVKDGTTMNAQSTGVTVATGTRWEMIVDLSEYNSGKIHFLIDGVRVYTHSSNLPGSTQSLDPYVSSRDTSGGTGNSILVCCCQAIG